ncbi:hypothetical protein AJ79_00306 [Helicocarpus griseus UAMH5409]|uniref:Nitrogen permease regulator 3 n=1 Tax=Helicocarpus griseus UAMH5409 TaxID=1447875 RepID=A0A2B7YBQ8_9EURO|nr:hypothetical protein AJ79_00306 [Helicocarpus griseus UAMH5409]
MSSSIVRPPDPCLVAIILIIQSRAGPRFVYHYPANPSTVIDNNPRGSSRPKTNAKSSDSSPSSDDDKSSSDEEEGGNSSAAGGSLARGASEHSSRSALSDKDAHQSSSRGQSSCSSGKRRSATPDSKPHNQPDVGRGEAPGELFQPPWESLLGLPTSVWEKLLSPSPAWHKRRFEVGVNDLAFVGWPVFVREDGSWRKRKKKKKKKTRKQRASEEREELGEGEKERDELRDDALSMQVSEAEGENDDPAGDAMVSDAPPGSPEGDKDSMTMFNVVFVLNPPLLEYGLRIREKYENVIKKFGKGLKSEQARVDYVWREAQTILNIKEKGRENKSTLDELYLELSSKSSLARAISTVYTSISSSKIASVTLTPEATMSLQVPPLTSTPYLPTATETAYPGLWLTTADSLSATDDVTGMETSGPNQVLAKHFALLLLTDEATILKDIEGSVGPLGPRLAHYIRASKPTKSFAQISAQSGIPLSDIQVLASHLVYWRRARAVPPLSQRDTYIVSPNANMSILAQAAATYENTFPTMPSLPKMLHALSDTPKPYSRLIPSRDHKETYYAILAWMLRGGWVTQLRTFGWVRVDPENKRAVEEALEREKEDKEGEEKEHATMTSLDKGQQQQQQQQGRNHVNDYGDRDDSDAHSSSSSSLESEASGDITPVPYRFTPKQKQKGPPPTSSLILRPHRASPLESRWLDQIVSQFPDSSHSTNMDSTSNTPTPTPTVIQEDNADTDSSSLRKHWPLFTKYFNGTDALEKIPVREGLNRKVVWRLLNRMDRSTLQPGDEGSGSSSSKEKVLVTVRHW